MEPHESYSTSGQAALQCSQTSLCQDSQSDHVPSDTVAAGHQAAVLYKCLSGWSFLITKPKISVPKTFLLSVKSLTTLQIQTCQNCLKITTAAKLNPLAFIATNEFNEWQQAHCIFDHIFCF